MTDHDDRDDVSPARAIETYREVAERLHRLQPFELYDRLAELKRDDPTMHALVLHHLKLRRPR